MPRPTVTTEVPDSISDTVYTKTMADLIDFVASYQYVVGADPTIGAALEHVAEICRRIWNDRVALNSEHWKP